MALTLIEKLIESGYPADEIFNHCSDMYIYVTPLTKKVIDEWFREQKLKKHLFVSIFTDQITGKPMYDCAFQYTPYWAKERSRQ